MSCRRKPWCGQKNFKLVQNDALTTDICDAIRPATQARVVANLPYNVATAIEAGGLGVTLLIAVGPMGMVGAVAGAIATMVGRIAANAYLWLQLRRPIPQR